MNYQWNIFCLLLIGIFFIPGMVSAEEGTWQHGSLFSAPQWLLDMYDDPDTMSDTMDYSGYQEQAHNTTTTTVNDYLKQGWGYLEGGNNKDALTAFESALEMNQNSGDAWYGKGLALENQKRYLSAIDAFSKAISNSMKTVDTWQAYAGRGRCYIAVQQYDNAKKSLNTALSLYENTGANDPEELASIKENLAKANSINGGSTQTNLSE
jgi:tetratricopeptide (TPR) repeat protein